MSFDFFQTEVIIDVDVVDSLSKMNAGSALRC